MEQYLKNFASRVVSKLTGRSSLEVSDNLSSAENLADYQAFLAALEIRLNSFAVNQQPNEFFADVTDDLWLWLCTEGYRNSAPLRNLLPGLPDETVQLTYTGDKGDSVLKDG